MSDYPAYHPGRGPRRRQFFRARTSREVRSAGGVLVAPDRAHSVGITQGAFSVSGASDVTFPTLDSGGIGWWIDVTLTDQDPATAELDPFTAAATDAHRHPIAVLQIDWDRDDYQSDYADLSDAVSEIRIERTAVGDLPDEVGLIEGHTIAQLTATLEGTVGDTTVLDLLGPYRPESPLYRAVTLNAPMRCQLGFLTDDGPVLVDQITGHVRSLDPNSSSRQVGLTAFDPADLLRESITLPAYAMDRDEYLGGHKFFVNTQAIIDYVLRKNGIYASTAPHPDAQISCTGHGWLAADIGRNAVPRGQAATTTDDNWWVPGPFDLLAVRGDWDSASYQEFFSREPLIPVAGRGIGIGVWLRVGNDMPVTGGQPVLGLMPLVAHPDWRYTIDVFDDGNVVARIGYNNDASITSGAARRAGPMGWRYVGVHYQHLVTGQTVTRVRMDGITAAVTETTPTFTGPVAPFLQVTAWMTLSWADFQVWYDPDPPTGAWPGETGLDEADLDVGLNRMTHVPDVVATDSWQVIRDAAAAEYGQVGFSPGGRFFFESRASAVNELGTVEEEITADTTLLDLASSLTVDTVRNVITTETAAGFLDFVNLIFEAQGVTQFDTPTGTSVFDVVLPYSAIGNPTQALPQVLNASWGAAVLWGYVAVQADNPTIEIDLADDLEVLFAMTGDRAGRITVRNNTPHRVRMATTSGQPALRVQGWLLEMTPTAVEYNGSWGSVATYGVRSLAVGGSPWRQLLDAMRPVALRLLAQLAHPVPVIDQFSAVGNPAREVGDTVWVVDPAGQGRIKATIVKINRVLSDTGGLVDQLSVRPIGPPGVIILGDPDFGIIGDPNLWLAP